MTSDEPVNARRPEWYRYQQDRQQRRQDHVAAIARAAGQEAPNPVERVKADYAAARAAEKAFDAAEPELDYVAWKSAA